MYHDLRSKLELLKNKQSIKPSKPKNSGLDIHDLISGALCSNDDGSYFVIENRYPIQYLHGGCRLGDALQVGMASLKRLCTDLKEGQSVSDFLFLDTETTGLSGGAGTVAFLIGVGFFKEDEFILRQYFMRDYDEEPAVLRDLGLLLADYRVLVTFNGKAFDWNLLKSRFTFNRIRPMPKEPVHMDLLYPSRRIWKAKLESCRLISLEENILGEKRVDDIPGAMIPGVYFKYLEDRNATEIKKVIKHNEEDILSMVSLMVKISSMLENPVEGTDGSHELLGVGRIFEAGGEYDTVIGCYEACMGSDSFFVREAASKRLVDIYKKSKDYEKFVEHCESMVDGSKLHGINIMVELAKYYEHREKNMEKAIEVVEKALDASLSLGLRNNMYYGELKARLERLKRKAERRQRVDDGLREGKLF